MPVPGVARGGKKRYPIKQGCNADGTAAHIAFPKFKVPAVAILPVFIEVNQQVEAAVEVAEFMFMKIYV